MANNKFTNVTLFLWMNCNIRKSGFEMVRNALLILTGLTIFLGKPTLESRILESFCEPGEPEVIDVTASGKGEIKVDSLSLARNWLVNVSKEDSSGIYMNFQSFLLEDYFLVIRDGIDSRSNDGMVQFISGRSEEPVSFRIPFCQSFYMEVCPEHETVSSLKKGYFNMSFVRTVFEDSLPEEKPDVQIEKESYEVQLKGHPPEKFKESGFVWDLKEIIKNVAGVYCRYSNLTFDAGKTADEMVTILAVRRCPAEWYDTHICASIRHSVYVTPEHKGPVAVWNYQLTRKHLQEMWESVNDSYFESLNLTIYRFTKKDEVLKWWSLLILSPLVILIIMTLSVMKMYGYLKEDKQMKHSAGSESMTTSSRRRIKLKPNKHQYIPPFIENQSEKSHSHKRQSPYEAEGQHVEEQSYFGPLLLPRLARNYSSYNNNNTTN